MILIDSSGWLEFFSEGPHAEEFAKHLRRPEQVLTPTIAIYEVYKWIKRERSEEAAVFAAATMKKTVVVDLNDEIALTAADISLSHELAMADAIILATARAHEATVLTTGSDFNAVSGATVVSKRR